MNKHFLPALALGVAGLLSGAAQAETYQLDFTASDYAVVIAGDDAPQSAVSGWFRFEAASLGAEIDKVTGVNLTIGGHTYTTAEIGGEYMFGKYQFGENLLSPINAVSPPANDFLFEFGPSAQSKTSFYSVAGSDYAWMTKDITYAVTAIPAVPEPASVLMMLAGLGVVGAVARRRTR